MKKLILILTLTFSTTIKAQDPNCGILINGVLVDTIPSWNFETMSVVFPITKEWAKFDIIICDLVTPQGANNGISANQNGIATLVLKPEDLSDFSDAKYIVWNIFTKEGNNGNANMSNFKISNRRDADYSTKTMVYQEIVKTFEGQKLREKKYFPMVLYIHGHKITATSEEFEGDKSLKQYRYDDKKVYEEELSCLGFREHVLPESQTIIYKSKEVFYPICNCAPDKKTYKNALSLESINCEECKIDYAKPCKPAGKKYALTIDKVDFGNKFGKIKK